MQKLVLIFFGLLTVAFFSLYYQFHFKWRSCFNEEGRCFVPESSTVYHEQSGMVYLSLAGVSLLLLLQQVYRIFCRS